MSESGLPVSNGAAPVQPGTPTPGVARSAGLAGIATLASRLLGLVRDQVLAAFGAGNEMDAFIVAFRVPNLVRDLFAEGRDERGLRAHLHPRAHARAARRRAWRLGNNVLNALLVVTGVIVVARPGVRRPLVGASPPTSPRCRASSSSPRAHAGRCCRS